MTFRGVRLSTVLVKCCTGRQPAVWSTALPHAIALFSPLACLSRHRFDNLHVKMLRLERCLKSSQRVAVNGLTRGGGVYLVCLYLLDKVWCEGNQINLPNMQSHGSEHERSISTRSGFFGGQTAYDPVHEMDFHASPKLGEEEPRPGPGPGPGPKRRAAISWPGHSLAPAARPKMTVR